MNRLKTLIFCGLIFSIVGLIDWLVGIFYHIYQTRADGLWVLLEGFFWGRVLYFALGLGFGLVWILFSGIFLRKETKSADGLIVGIILGIFTLFLLEAFAPIRTNWKLFLDFIFFGFLGIICGAGARFVWERYFARIFGEGLKPGWALFSSLLLSGLFAGGWIVGLSLSLKGKLFMILLAGGIFFFSLFLNWLIFRRYSKVMLGVYLVCFFTLASFPFWFMERKPVYPDLGQAKNPLNIIWIIADACRADALGVYGGSNQTPGLDQLAREGVLFKRAYAQAPWTLPSMLSMFSSLYPSIFQYGKPYYAEKEIEIFSERLKSYGYYNQAVVANPLLTGSSGIIQGFDRVISYRNHYRLVKLLSHPVVIKTQYLLFRILKKDYLPDTTRLITEQAIKFLKQKKTPFFLWLHYMNPHAPYNPPERFLKEIKYNGFLRAPFKPDDPFHIPNDLAHPQGSDLKLGYIFLRKPDQDFVRQLYLLYLRYLDEKIKELLDVLQKQGLKENTLIIFTADHGEEFWEHNQWGHNHSLYEELLHIPLIIWGAGLKPQVVEEPIMALDLVPTLARILGISPNPLWQGKAFEGLWGEKSEEERIIFAEGTLRPEDMRAIIKGKKKLIVGLHTGRKWFFELESDPKEQRNLYQPDNPVCQELEALLSQWIKENYAFRSRLSLGKLSSVREKEFEEKLKSLGYLR